ncbi:LysR family transcriptional regulator [Roseateles koreensis]|uniref:LysR family transcriptional regulator n=1 Tax=Roseateles koreensis TaxID=2987526 RepID=A0ABT5KNR2_9BURK|nr:LysR family transcriptional regulator [Roseateles koreensis]MDC8784497.1 LysR family transcriptional regulator [Roseateles koreensis]
MIELRPLRQFVAVAEELHFGRAARRLHMTQPPLTLAIQKLEADMAVQLFERSSRTVTLTPAGAALLPQAQALLAQASALPGVVQAAAKGESGRLRLGFVSTVGYGELPRWLRDFRECFPDIALTLRESTLDVQLQAFDRDELDAGFIIHAPGAVPPGFEACTVASEPLVLALSADSQLAGHRRLSLVQVAGEPLVIFPREIAPSLFDAILAVYRTQGVAAGIVQEAIQMQTIVNLVSAGMGLAWVPASVQSFQRPGVVYKPVQGAVPICETSLIWRRTAAPAVLRFVAHVQQAVGLGGGTIHSL